MRKGNGGLIGPLNDPTATVASGMFSMDEQQQSLGARNWPGTPAATKPNPPSFANAASFTASISDATMTVTAIASGTLAVGQVISGVGVTQYTIITAQLTGTAGSTGTYTVSIGQTVASVSMNATLSLTSVTSTTSSVVVPFITGYDGGSPLTSVTANVYNGSTLVGTASGLSSPLTVPSLPNNTVYTIALVATNAQGDSSPSSGPYFRSPGVPGAPTGATATVSGNDVSVAFTAPTSNNGSAVTSYTVTSHPDNVTATGNSSPILVSGLQGSTTYNFTVQASNLIGIGAASASSNNVTTADFVSVSYLIAAGGGGGGALIGGGGGAGGVKTGSIGLNTGISYTVAVGSGGNGAPGGGGPYYGQQGASSSFSTISVTGGGYGAYNTAPGNGGSGGGASGYFAGGAAGTGIAGQGYAGGSNTGGVNVPGGGGGGAGAVGGNGLAAAAGAGGIGISSSITGIATYYGGGGGGGGGSYNSAPAGAGGNGGGGAGSASSTVNPIAGAANTGGGGGGSGWTNGSGTYNAGANGGLGVMILSIAATDVGADTVGAPVFSMDGTNKVYKFIGNGSFTLRKGAVPDAPTIGTATLSGALGASVTFTPPTNVGGGPIQSYTVTSTPGGITATGTSSPIVVSGLSAVTSYTFAVTATNAIGTSAASAASNSITTTSPYSLLMHFDGTNGSTTFTDASGQNTFAIDAGSPIISTAQSKFGGASLRVATAAAAAQISTANNARFAPGTGAFTIEGWIYPTAPSGYQCVFSSRSPTDYAQAFFVGLSYSNVILFASGSIITSSMTIPTNAWSHFAISKPGGPGTTVYMYVNGAFAGSFTGPLDFSNTDCTIGGSKYGGPGAYPFVGYIDEFRILKGVGAYSGTGSITVPTSPFVYPEV